MKGHTGDPRVSNHRLYLRRFSVTSPPTSVEGYFVRVVDRPGRKGGVGVQKNRRKSLFDEVVYDGRTTWRQTFQCRPCHSQGLVLYPHGFEDGVLTWPQTWHRQKRRKFWTNDGGLRKESKGFRTENTQVEFTSRTSCASRPRGWGDRFKFRNGKVKFRLVRILSLTWRDSGSKIKKVEKIEI